MGILYEVTFDLACEYGVAILLFLKIQYIYQVNISWCVQVLQHVVAVSVCHTPYLHIL